MLDGVTIIDADGHVLDREDLLGPYLDPAYQNRRLFPANTGWDIRMNGKYDIPSYDIPTRLRDMGEEGIDVAFLYPTQGLNIGRSRGEPDYLEAMCRAYNNWLAGFCRQAPDRLKMVAIVPPQLPEFCEREVSRAVTDLGAMAVMLPAHGHGKNLGSREFHPFYAECQRLGIPVGLHSAASHAVNNYIPWETYIGVHAIDHPVPMIIECTAIVLGGIPELFPELRIAFLEAGVGWVPFWMERLDGEFEKRRPEAPYLKARPSEYMKSGRLYYGGEPGEELLPWMMSEVGEGVVLFASDYPHWDADFPHSARELMERTDLTDEQKRKIMTENPQRFYGMKVAALV